MIGLQTGLLLSGAILTETVFARPGVGTWLSEAIFNRDYPVLQGGILFVAVVFVLVNLLVDLSYALINPRIRLLADVVAELEAAGGRARGAERRALVATRGCGCAATRARSSGFVLVRVVRRLRDLRAVDRAAQAARPGSHAARRTGSRPGPSRAHWFGVDTLGRDEFSRIIYGARLSLIVGVVSVAVGLSVGMMFGSHRRLPRRLSSTTLIMRVMDIVLAIPGLLFAIGVVALLGPGLFHIMIAVGVTQVPIFARLLRGSILAAAGERLRARGALRRRAAAARSLSRTSSRMRSRR